MSTPYYACPKIHSVPSVLALIPKNIHNSRPLSFITHGPLCLHPHPKKQKTMNGTTDPFEMSFSRSPSSSFAADIALAKHEYPPVDTGTATPADDSNERSRAHDSSTANGLQSAQPRYHVAERELENET